jgi:imidazolonepropionase-like amidohydrolase
MVAYGMKPADALRAATATAAKVLGHEKDLGTISEGAFADMIAVAGDPLADVARLRKPAFVIKAGVVAIDRR